MEDVVVWTVNESEKQFSSHTGRITQQSDSFNTHVCYFYLELALFRVLEFVRGIAVGLGNDNAR